MGTIFCCSWYHSLLPLICFFFYYVCIPWLGSSRIFLSLLFYTELVMKSYQFYHFCSCWMSSSSLSSGSQKSLTWFFSSLYSLYSFPLFPLFTLLSVFFIVAQMLFLKVKAITSLKIHTTASSCPRIRPHSEADSYCPPSLDPTSLSVLIPPTFL